MEDYITLAIFTYPHEYVVLELLLKQEGIDHYFQNEATIGIFPFYSNALGGIRLKVHRIHEPKAKEILDRFNNQTSHLKIV